MSEPEITIAAGPNNQGGYQQQPMQWVVIHDEEYPTGPNSAESVAQFFASRPTFPNDYGSSQYVEDANSEQHCVIEARASYHAPPLSFMGSVGIEQDGYASYTREEWLDRSSGSGLTLIRTASRTAELCVRYGIPTTFVRAADLIRGVPGITSHNEVSLAWRQSDHSDPGPNFPWDIFLGYVEAGVKLIKGGLNPDPLDNLFSAIRDGGVPAAPANVGPASFAYPVINVQKANWNSPWFKVIQVCLEMHGFGPKNFQNNSNNNEVVRQLKAFQKDRKLEVDGIVGDMTWFYLFIHPDNPKGLDNPKGPQWPTINTAPHKFSYRVMWVRIAEQFLASWGSYILPDADLGQKDPNMFILNTVVKQFQFSKSIPVTGIIDAKTWTALRSKR